VAVRGKNEIIVVLPGITSSLYEESTRGIFIQIILIQTGKIKMGGKFSER
jgi:hypothetical protein